MTRSPDEPSGTSSDGAGASGSGTATLRAAIPPGGAPPGPVRQVWEKQLGRYQLVEVLGHGAMATVFRALDTQLGRQVAVKVMNLAVAARSDSAERFRREAQAVAAIKHPGIVEIFDFVAASGAEPAYIVSELIEGSTLKTWLERRSGRVLPEMAALLALPLAEALAVAHARGIVHRDIKPDNVMIDRGGGGCRVVLTDFGVAHVTGLETMTATGALVGSPAYMSPEQARGHEVGPSSDVWAAGVLLYEMATGHLPFTGRDPLMVVAAITRGTYKRPSQVSPYAGSNFDDICNRCLQPAGAGRYANARELATDLRAFCADAGLEPVGETLRSWMEAPEIFEAEVRARTADRAVASARKHARRGEFARALTELSRASAYVPKHAEADRLIAKISSRRRWLKLGAVAAAILAVGATMMVLAPRLTTPEETELRRTEAAEKAQARKAAEATAGERAAGAGGATPAVTAKTEAQRGGSGGRRRKARVVASGETPRTVPVPEKATEKATETATKTATETATEKTEATGPASPPGATTDEATTAPPTGAPAVVAAPAVVTPLPPAAVPRLIAVEIFAEYLLCNPSLDDDKAQVSPVRKRVPPGTHRIYCSTIKAGRVLVATVQIGETASDKTVRIQIRQGPGDKPEIDLSRSTFPPATMGIPGPR
jgi:hypothetical protein